jgi:hypothetical protein
MAPAGKIFVQNGFVMMAKFFVMMALVLVM